MNERQTPVRRKVLKWIAAGALGPVTLSDLHAAEFPERQVRIVNPTAPGGTVDMVSRIMGEKMAPHLGQPVVVEHRPGGSGAIGASLVSKGPKDGYMVFIGTSSTLGFMKMLNKDLSYEPVKDFAPVACRSGYSPAAARGSRPSRIWWRPPRPSRAN